ncbi:hypothetical protein OG259_11535 [Streptomyces sp. NBC_00250]|uniref:hypothetical protein n=1 Tax=Streptomyces sp. NBC_00250 TaxID=2903641 RepID=UPI002E2A029A|nr:hypothetical protein [Streptomyces sp. NBC_00250]
MESTEKWIVFAQYKSGDSCFTEVVSRVTGTREDAREQLLAATRAYHAPMREKWREVYRMPGGDSYLVIVKGAVTLSEITMGIAELVHDSKDGKTE